MSNLAVSVNGANGQAYDFQASFCQSVIGFGVGCGGNDTNLLGQTMHLCRQGPSFSGTYDSIGLGCPGDANNQLCKVFFGAKRLSFENILAVPVHIRLFSLSSARI